MMKAKDTLITQMMRDDVSATPGAERGLDEESAGGWTTHQMRKSNFLTLQVSIFIDVSLIVDGPMNSNMIFSN